MEFLTLKEIAGDHLDIYEKYYAQVNPTNADIIKALDAASFIRKSGLNQITLKNVWDLSDPNCLGYLDKKALFVALKLIAMVQNGRPLNTQDLQTPLPPPIIGDNVVKGLDWQVAPEDIQKYLVTFRSMNPVDEKLPGNKVKPIMVDSKLPLDILTKIWDLSDIDQDGFLNKKEFVLCCHLIAKTQQGYTIPPELPPELASLNVEVSRAGSLTASPLTISADAQNKWVISEEQKNLYDLEFIKLDKDCDGFVTGLDVKDTLLQSGLPQNVLAHIWNLCDILSNGKLNKEQFAMANYFIKQKQNGIELPAKLLPNMVPPSFRPKQAEPTPVRPASPISEMGRELQAMQDDIRNLEQTKKQQEEEILKEEISLKKKQSEKLSIENEIETLATMLKQMDNQKNDAIKKLKDLDIQVENLNQQMLEQKTKIDQEEADLKSKSKEFTAQREEELSLEASLNSAKNEVEQITQTAAETQLEISHIKADMMELDEYKRRVNEMLDDYDTAISSFDYAKITSLLPRNITPPPFLTDFDDSKGEFSSDPFAGDDPFKDEAAFNNEPFDPFGINANNNNNEKGDSFGFNAFPDNANDPFRTESPTPALPPKNSKGPPPRPAPPKTANKTPLRAAPPPPGNKSKNFDPFIDPFGSDSFSGQGFADFGNFDAK